MTESHSRDQKAWWEGMDKSRQCRLVLNDPQRGYMRLCQQSSGLFKYHSKLTKSALNAQYEIAYKDTGERKLGAGTWIKTVRDAGDEDRDRWVGVGVWGKVFKSFRLALEERDVEWKPDNHSFVLCFDSLDKEEVSIRGLDVKYRVRIVTTFIPNVDFLRKSLNQAIRRSAEIQILLLDYDSPQVAYRADALGITKAKMTQEIHRSIKFLTEFYHDPEIARLEPSRFEVRLFDASPIASLYWFDNVCYLGLHWMRQNSTEAPQLRLEKEKNHVLFSSMEIHFDALWSESKPILSSL